MTNPTPVCPADIAFMPDASMTGKLLAKNREFTSHVPTAGSPTKKG